MKIRVYCIFVFALLSITIFGYTQNTEDDGVIIEVSRMKNDDNIFCLQITLNSINYIDSLGIQMNTENPEKIVKFDKQTRKATIEYYILKQDILKKNVLLKIYADGNYKKFLQKIYFE